MGGRLQLLRLRRAAGCMQAALEIGNENVESVSMGKIMGRSGRAEGNFYLDLMGFADIWSFISVAMLSPC